MSDFQHDCWVKARKKHKCGEDRCKRTKLIQPGQHYRRYVGVYDGSFYNFVSCERCAKLRTKWIKKFDPKHEDEYPCFGELLFWAQEARRW